MYPFELLFGPPPFRDFLAQLVVGVGKLLGPSFDARLKLAVSFLQILLASFYLFEHAIERVVENSQLVIAGLDDADGIVAVLRNPLGCLGQSENRLGNDPLQP